MERLKRCADTSPARDRIDRCDDMVFCGTASALAMSPAASPSGSCFTNSRNTSSRVDWASAASARMAGSDSTYPELWIYFFVSSENGSAAKIDFHLQRRLYFHNSRNIHSQHRLIMKDYRHETARRRRASPSAGQSDPAQDLPRPDSRGRRGIAGRTA